MRRYMLSNYSATPRLRNKRLRLNKLFRFSVLVLFVATQWSFIPVSIDKAAASKNPFFPAAASIAGLAGANSILSMSPVMARMNVYDSLQLGAIGLSKSVFQLALKGLDKLWRTGKVKENIISIVDFSQPSNHKRLYVINLDNAQLLFNTLVAHGQRSGRDMARVFSNRPRSLQSSLGFYITGNVYQGSNGYSLKLQGIEKGINDQAYRRAIVMHGADYVSESWINNQGYLGRSQGCPAVPLDVSRPIIDEIKEGTCLFIYHPTSWYRSRSRMIR